MTHADTPHALGDVMVDESPAGSQLKTCSLRRYPKVRVPEP